MKVKILVSRQGPNVNDTPGKIYEDMPDDEAQRLIDAGQAEAIVDNPSAAGAGSEPTGAQEPGAAGAESGAAAESGDAGSAGAQENAGEGDGESAAKTEGAKPKRKAAPKRSTSTENTAK